MNHGFKIFAIIMALFTVAQPAHCGSDEDELAAIRNIFQLRKLDSQLCAIGKRRFRLIDGKVYDLQPIANYYAWAASLLPNQEGLAASKKAVWPLPGWELVYATVVQITEHEGILINKYSSPARDEEPQFVRVRDIPTEDKMIDGDHVVFIAREDGRYRYENTQGAVRTIASYDYGRRPTPEQMEQAVKELEQKVNSQAKLLQEQEALLAEKKKQQAAQVKINTFNFYLEKANNGEAPAQLRVGQMYLAGEGTDKNETEARKWLAAAAAKTP